MSGFWFCSVPVVRPTALRQEGELAGEECGCYQRICDELQDAQVMANGTLAVWLGDWECWGHHGGEAKCNTATLLPPTLPTPWISLFFPDFTQRPGFRIVKL